MRKLRSEINYGAKGNCPFDAGPVRMTGYRATIKYASRQMTVDFWSGPANGWPTTFDVAYCLCSDASMVESTSGDFWGWCEEFGMEPSRSARENYNLVQKQAAALRKLLGDDFDEVAFLDEDALAARCS
jgi:hypothetical protein